MTQSTQQAGASGGNRTPVSEQNTIGGGTDAELASALAAAGEASGGITFAEPDGDGDKKEAKPKLKIKPASKQAARKKSKRQSTDFDDGDDEGTGSGILDTLNEIQSKQKKTTSSDDSGDGDDTDAAELDRILGVTQDDGSGSGEEDGGDQEDDDGEIEGVEEVDTNIPVSQQIKEKFKRFKGNEKALRTHVISAREEAKAAKAELERVQLELKQAKDGTSGHTGDVLESEPYKELQKRTEAAESLVSRLRLEESPQFKEKYDAKIARGVKSAQPFIQGIKDQAVRDLTIAHLDNAVNKIPAGEENDPAFYEAVTEITKNEAFPEHLKAPVYTKLASIRETINERHEAVQNWKEESKALGSEMALGQQERVQAGVAALKKITSQYEQANADRLEVYRSEGAREAFQYDEHVGPSMKLLESEIATSVQAGGPSPKLIALAQRGTEHGFQMRLATQVAGLYKKASEENAILKKALLKFRKGGTGGGSTKGSGGEGSGGGEAAPKDYEGGSGILQTIKEMGQQ